MIMRNGYDIYTRLVDRCDQWNVRVKAAHLTKEGGYAVICDLDEPKDKRYSVLYIDNTAFMHRVSGDLNAKKAIEKFERKTGVRVYSLTIDGVRVK